MVQNSVLAKLKAVGDCIFVQPQAAQETTKGGIIIPDNAKQKPRMGTVVAVGAGGRDQSGNLIPMEVKKGDMVMYTKWGGNEVEIDGEELIVLRPSDIIAIINQ